MKTLRVLHIIDSGGLYGAEIMLLHLVEEQIALCLKPTIVSIGEKGISEKPFETEAIKRGFPLKKLRMVPGPNIAGAYSILKYAHQGNFTLLHSHGYKGNILLGFIPKSLRKIPILTTLHGYTSTNSLSKMKLYEWLDTMSHKFIDAVVLVNKGMLNHPKLENKNRKKYHIIDNGIKIHNSAPKVINKRVIQQINIFSKDHFVIGSIGRLSTEKGYNYLIESISLLIKKGIKARLIIIGEGYERERLEHQVLKFDLVKDVLFTGYLENAHQYIPYFSVYAISSLTEGLPITLLEAMRANIPIVASKVGGIPEVLQGNAGILVNPCNPDELSEAFFRLSNNNDYAIELIKKAYYKVTEKYSSQAMATKYIKLYKNMINKVR